MKQSEFIDQLYLEAQKLGFDAPSGAMLEEAFYDWRQIVLAEVDDALNLAGFTQAAKYLENQEKLMELEDCY